MKEPDKPVPLLIFLHGRGEMGDSLNELSKVRVHGPLSYIDQGNELPFIVVAPQMKKGDKFWSRAFFDMIIKDVEQNYPVDSSRIYLTGISLGGYATWYFAMTYPDKFAAIAPIAGGDIFQFDLAGIGKEMSTICKIKHVPAWVVHGNRDFVVPANDAKELVAELKKCGANVKFTLYKDKGHISWKETYDDPAFYKWLMSQRTNLGNR